jgi:hypothetical protein
MHSRREIEGRACEIERMAIDLMAFLSTINSHFAIFGLAFGGKWQHLTELSFPGPTQARCTPGAIFHAKLSAWQSI